MGILSCRIDCILSEATSGLSFEIECLVLGFLYREWVTGTLVNREQVFDICNSTHRNLQAGFLPCRNMADALKSSEVRVEYNSTQSGLRRITLRERPETSMRPPWLLGFQRYWEPRALAGI